MTSSAVANLEAALTARLQGNKLKIPPCPAVTAKLERLARQGGCSLDELAKVVSSDPALAAAVLGRARTAAAGGRQVTTLFDALARVGFDQLVEMALATGLGQAVTAAGPLAELRRDTWRRALLSAHLARMLAGNRGLSGDAAYLAGLLHEFGATIVIGGLEDLAKAAPLPVMSEAQWRSLVKHRQVQFGMVVAARWNLPEPITDVIAHHLDREPASKLAQLIQLTDQIIEKLDGNPTAGLASLLDIPGLSEMERRTVGSVVQEVVQSMAKYVAPTATNPAPNVIERAATSEPVFPVSFEISQPHHEPYRARTISPNALSLEGPSELSPNWLVELTLNCTPAPITMLAQVRSCTKVGDRFEVHVQPFALAGTAKEQWMALLDEARRQPS
ncbi:hypothetical protein BH11MYX1_BH11MYX1_02520 [soil metagenome]